MNEQGIMKRIAILLAAALMAASCSGKGWGDKVVVCGDSTLYIVDVEKSAEGIPAIVWQWDIKDAAAQLPEDFPGRNRSLDDCKPVAGGSQILVTSSSSSTILLDIATRKCLFYARTPMAHSAEMLPGGRIIVANSTHPEGNNLSLYDIANSDVCIWKDSLYSGHGVVWSEKYKSLYALGYKELRRYSLKDWDGPTPSLELEQTWELPGISGHELSPCGKDGLIVSVHEGVFVFDMESGGFSAFEPLEGVNNVKSVNYEPESGRLIYTKAETSWWTDHVYFDNPSLTLSFDPSYKMYKVRPFAGSRIKFPVDESVSAPAQMPGPGEVVTDEMLSAHPYTDFFSVQPIPDNIFALMRGKTYKDDCTVPRDDLRYLLCLHKDLEGRSIVGEMVVSKDVAGTLRDIFLKLYEASYPIEKMRLPDYWDADDGLMMRDNNSSCFNFRRISGSSSLSRHSLGIAVDINPLYNPYVKVRNGVTVIDPPTGAPYADRSADFIYKISEDDLCFRLFKEAGFEWGGDWTSLKDYQHFELKAVSAK